jgi:hypothetical protein
VGFQLEFFVFFEIVEILEDASQVHLQRAARNRLGFGAETEGIELEFRATVVWEIVDLVTGDDLSLRIIKLILLKLFL